MERKWFRHSKWPLTFVRTHWFALSAFTFLLITGLLLFLPQVHTTLIPILPLLYDLHITFGILLGLALLIPFLKRLPKGKKIRRLDWVLTQTMLAAITVSGIVLWRIAFFPAQWRSLAFTLHGDFAYILAGWIVVHFVMRAFSIGVKGESFVSRRVLWERRQFIKWTAYGTLGMFAWLFIGSSPFRGIGKESAVSAGTPPANPGAIPPFPEYYTVTGGFPQQNDATFRLTVDGLVDHPQVLTLAAVKKIAKHRILRNFQCVTGWVVPNVVWTGVPLSEFAKLAGVKSDAQYITFYSADGVYTDSLSLSQAYRSDVMLAYAINDKDLPVQQGYPIRLIVPEMYGYKSIKWVNRIEFSKTRKLGYWEVNGYPADAYIQ